MMSLIQTIKADQLQARKNKEQLRASLLTTLLGEATAIGKNDGNRETTDAEVMAMIKKFVKNINDTLPHRPNDTNLIEERDILMQYLPKQLTSEELVLVVQNIIAENDLEGPKAMGAVMKVLKEHHDGQYEGKLASQIAREALS